MVWVVLTGMPKWEARNSVIAPLVSAQKPPNGVSLVIRWPIVRTMRHPPAMVPSPIAACAERITQMGMWSALGRWNAWTGNATNSAELEARRATMIPIVFWASLVPCPSEYSAADTSCSSRNARSTRRGKERRSTQDKRTVNARARVSPRSGATTMKISVLTHPEVMMAANPAFATAAPA